MDTNELTRPATWQETLLALGTFLIFPLGFLIALLLVPFLNAPIEPDLGLGITLAVIGILLIVMVAGWVQSFPRWVFPYWGFILTITLYMWKFTGTIAGYQVRGNWWAWTPLVGIAVVGSLWAWSLQPVVALFKSIWRDWTLLSFAFYGALPLLFFAAYDEVHNEGPVLAVIMLALVAGIVFYMRTETTWHRLASLVGGFTAGWIILMIHQSLYWNGRQDFWMPRLGSWTETLNWTSRMGAMLMLILVAPMLIELLRLALKSRRAPKSAG